MKDSDKCRGGQIRAAADVLYKIVRSIVCGGFAVVVVTVALLISVLWLIPLFVCLMCVCKDFSSFADVFCSNIRYGYKSLYECIKSLFIS